MNSTLKSLTRREPCPDADAWAAFLAGESLNPETLEAHRKQCAACEAEVRMMSAFLDGRPNPEEEEDLRWIEQKLQRPAVSAARPESPVRAPFWQPWRMLAGVAAMLVMLVVGQQWSRQRVPEISGGPGEGPGVLRARQSIEIETPVGDVASPPKEIRWKSISGATRYQVKILEVDGTELMTLTSAGPISLDVPARVFLPRKALLMKISAFGQDGSILAESGEVRVRFIPGGN